ncbi:hypothetical protein [Flavobacterium sp.]|uniref:hypothetical protein n=1 Tax=Flavobacterium sp. TaxID=239 RepID=UPI003D2A2EAE
MKKFFLLIFFFLSSTIHAQEIDTTRITLSKVEFEKLKSDFKKVSKTKLFQKNEKIRQNYLRNVFICSNNHTKIAVKDCLYEKLGNKGAKRIIKLGEKYVKLEKRLARKFPEIYVLLKKTTTEQRIELRKTY